jgi:hypothetical protein
MTPKRLRRCLATLPLVALGLALAAPATMRAQDGTLDPTFFGTGKFNFDQSFSPGVFDVRSAGVSPDGSKYWWAGQTNLSGVFYFGYQLRGVNDSAQFECHYLPVGATSAGVTAAAFDPSGRLVLAGWAFFGGDQRVVLTRIQNAAAGCGAPDPSFDETGGNHDGWVIYDLTHDAQASAIAFDPSGGIVVVGSTETAATHKDLLVLRLLATGALDNTFAAAGVKTLDCVTGDDYGMAVAVEVDPANDNPMTWAAVVSRSAAQMKMGRLAEAERGQRAAIAALTRLQGADSDAVRGPTKHLGETLRRQGRIAEALAMNERALAIETKLYGGRQTVGTATSHLQLAEDHLDEGTGAGLATARRGPRHSPPRARRTMRAKWRASSPRETARRGWRISRSAATSRQGAAGWPRRERGDEGGWGRRAQRAATVAAEARKRELCSQVGSGK